MGNRLKPGLASARRTLLKAAAWAAPVCAVGGPVLLQGCDSKPPLASNLDFLELSARDAVQHIQQGGMTAEGYAAQLLKQYVANKGLNTVITIDEQRLLELARAVDQARSRGDRLGPLSGLPFVVKDQIEVAGYPTTAGTPALKNYISKQSAPVVDTMLRNGAVMFAKANLQELAQGATSSNPGFGFVRNPYDPSRIPGGSSGGTAAALAARIVPAGLGEDSGGSIRIPAAFSGVAGLRPSTGGARKRYADAGLVPPARSDDPQTIGPMARTVSDLVLLDSVITGQQIAPLANLRDVRIGIPRADYWESEEVDAGLARTMRDAFAKLRNAGAQLVEFDLQGLVKVGDDVAPALVSANRDKDFAEWLEKNVPGLTMEAVVAGILSKDVKASREARLKAGPGTELPPDVRTAMRAAAAQKYADVFRSTGVTALAFPSVPVPAVPINSDGDSPDDQVAVNSKKLSRNFVVIHNTWFGARLGAPGLVVPAGLTDGLPVGMELDGLPDDDGKILALGLAIENVLGRLPAPASLRKAT